MVGNPLDAPGYRVYNPETRRITSAVHVVVQEDTPCFGTQPSVDSVITDSSADVPAASPLSHPIDLLGLDPDPTAPRIPETTRVRTRSRGLSDSDSYALEIHHNLPVHIQLLS
jgi:hypothetical protein